MRRRSRVLLRDAAATVLAVVVVAAVAGGGWRLFELVRHHQGLVHRTSATSTHRPTPTSSTVPGRLGASKTAHPTATTTPALGVYTGPGALSSAEQVNTEVGGKVSYALDFLPADTWTQLSDPGWLERSWASSPLTLVIAVPMLPASGGTLQQGAAGDYNEAFALLAQRLVGGGLGGSVLMVGWQPESASNPWQVTSAAQATAYVQFWDQIHGVMAGVPGAHFQFEWDAGDPGPSITPASLYPGDADVDIVASDAFDVGLNSVAPAQQWSALMNQSYGPAWFASFASAHGKRLAVAMCGLAPASAGGGGDNGVFVTQSLQWARSAHAAMYVLWDYGSWGVTDGGFPAGNAAMLQAVDQGFVGTAPVGTL